MQVTWYKYRATFEDGSQSIWNVNPIYHENESERIWNLETLNKKIKSELVPNVHIEFVPISPVDEIVMDEIQKVEKEIGFTQSKYYALMRSLIRE